MREIKFRGKRIDNGEWVIGYYGYKELSEEHFIIVPTFDQHSDIMPQYFTDLLVHADSVGQHTGLADRNGKEIYEGDLVYSSHRIYDDGIPLLNKIEFKDYCWRLIPINDTKASDAPLTLYAREPKALEVIGNVWENPELKGE